MAKGKRNDFSLEKVKAAEKFAANKHFGQVDKAGVEYFKHPLTVAGMLEGENEKIVALLHDTVEDTDATIEEIRSLFGDEVADAVSCLTHDKNVPYMEYIRNIKKNPLATKVKLADLSHNMDLSRLPEITKKDRERYEKYKKAYDLLSDFD